MMVIVVVAVVVMAAASVAAQVVVVHCKKRLAIFRPGRVWFVTSRLGTGKSLTFFYSVFVVVP
jgi:hypothetical protein